jgi:hypothetical protein
LLTLTLFSLLWLNPEPVTPPLHQATLRWQARDSEGVYGYLVYRATDRLGPFQRISPRILRVPADGQAQHSYVFEDRDVIVGKTYFYYIDGVNNSGQKSRFTGVLAKTIAVPAP